MKINLITRNPIKIKAAYGVFNKYNIQLSTIEKDYPEIQASTSLEIAKHTALEAAKEFNMPAIREDHSLFIHALNLPGPYVAYVEKILLAEKVIEICQKFNDFTGHFEVASVIASPNGQTFEYVFQIPLTFGFEIKGENPIGWDGIIRLLDETRAIAEYPEDKRLHIWSQGYEKIAQYILEKAKEEVEANSTQSKYI